MSNEIRDLLAQLGAIPKNTLLQLASWRVISDEDANIETSDLSKEDIVELVEKLRVAISKEAVTIRETELDLLEGEPSLIRINDGNPILASMDKFGRVIICWNDITSEPTTITFPNGSVARVAQLTPRFVGSDISYGVIELEDCDAKVIPIHQENGGNACDAEENSADVR